MAAYDWPAIEREYSRGVLTLREIGEAYGLTHAAIRKAALRNGWTRDLQARIQAKAEALVSKQAVSEEVSKANQATEREIVQANAEVVAAVKTRHRKSLARWQAMVDNLEARINADESLTVLQRAQVLKTAVDALRNLIASEREAYNFDAQPDKTTEDEDMEPREIARRIAFVFAQAKQRGATCH